MELFQATFTTNNGQDTSSEQNESRINDFLFLLEKLILLEKESSTNLTKMSHFNLGDCWGDPLNDVFKRLTYV